MVDAPGLHWSWRSNSSVHVARIGQRRWSQSAVPGLAALFPELAHRAADGGAQTPHWCIYLSTLYTSIHRRTVTPAPCHKGGGGRRVTQQTRRGVGGESSGHSRQPARSRLSQPTEQVGGRSERLYRAHSGLGGTLNQSTGLHILTLGAE